MPDFLPAAGRFLPLAAYDTAARLTMRERRWRPDLAARVAAVTPPHGAVVELGAGTGSLTHLLRAALPGTVTLTAVDPDERALAIARRRAPAPASAASAKAADIAWRPGRAEALPLPDATQDAVVTALVLHHLPTDAKRAALAEARRVLRPGGLLLVADFGPPQDPAMALAFRIIRLVDGPTTAGHADGIVADLVAQTGFTAPATVRRVRTAAGTLELLEARAA
ncbi:MAG TPA: class I SAM-dependent methyltransferase [Baekduia sp.]|uniref:class I SAM-dependent methyltransferase n=1 Tax=Baekduia sp. TaxID=2600305 RepID=UPI002D79E66B|nr:class I SAM-dependent methyltransferase [Baekduia sp.]HET6510310.1 class I SAM-dependent methyltransferase [Baekduia sp.]